MYKKTNIEPITAIVLVFYKQFIFSKKHVMILKFWLVLKIVTLLGYTPISA